MFFRSSFLLVLGCLTVACGGGSSNGPTAPTAPPPSTFTQRLTGSLAGDHAESHVLTVARSGNLTLDVSWPGTADLDVYLTDTGCTDIYQQRTCQLFGTADSGTQNPERITKSVTGGTSYRIWVVNYSVFTSANYTADVRIDYAATSQTLALTESRAQRGTTVTGHLPK